MTRTEQVEIDGVPLVATLRQGGGIGLLALHGSNEGGTGELADLIARRTGATSLVFTQPDVQRPVHLPSRRMAAEHCVLLRRFLDRVSLTVSLHGHMRPHAPRTVFLGGRNRAAALVLARELGELAPRFQAVTDLAAIPVALRGVHPRNPVNLTRLGGVQVELPLSARTTGSADVPPQPVADALVAGVLRLAQTSSMSAQEPL
ncbi:poly-gamma-glutamate hydrolase family protein [Streptomyces pluripotens]|uniref:poly-gamma-glutamate hydrolase family protein n=1 Tax=Streptomyces pluripotens TaxID=1355015 RepID=UPI00131DE6FD|nr:poly-gamma-glutamate hydrolase family protein [Streptomyces pluripotens]